MTPVCVFKQQFKSNFDLNCCFCVEIYARRMDKHGGESTTFELFTTFSDDTLDVERLFQASKRPFPSFSANSHPSVQNRSTLQLIYHLRRKW